MSDRFDLTPEDEGCPECGEEVTAYAYCCTSCSWTDQADEVARLQSRVAHLERREQTIVKALCTADGGQYVNDIVSGVERLQAQVARMREALAFYADRDNWHATVETATGEAECPYLGGPACDDGERARAALGPASASGEGS